MRDRHGSTPFLRVRGLVKHYGAYEALKSVSLDVAKGSAVALIGPSGSGKSTLLRCVNALEDVSSGTIEVGDFEIGYRSEGGRRRPLGASALAKQRESVGMVFQSFNLFPHMTALDNVTSGPRLVRGESPERARKRGMELLERVGLGSKAGHFPRQLSGGQQQRVAIARAMAMDPKIMLFDEPTSALDPETVQEVLNVIRDVRESGMTMLIATHEMAFARQVSDMTVFMEAGQIVEAGESSQVLFTPRTDRCKRFLAGLGNETAHA
ncbi:amino acid ABC transporter ATP-binding protein [Burkholderia multivorans]|nr:amino acid ABC transporter ATP-binding protein [Burkholderia multivorans]MCO1368557.1 amino acid ABC transporter ATP-binding protein [Burkholderia multivorans]MCO1380448.1 amino acid ABC transporter ATP-binding protein [Burkholderia multivorans]UQP22084.1 amino acid ABC transporter ATP-binding protein [Burkholderia multivorans]UQP92178.1 amino acid ABC transporter ATP-binding protein [Burkholderia multivorans]